MGAFMLQRSAETKSDEQGTKKRKNLPPYSILDPTWHGFFKDLVLYIAKGYDVFLLLKMHG